MPVLLLAVLVLERESEDCAGFLDGVLTVGFAGESGGDGVEGGGGREGSWEVVRVDRSRRRTGCWMAIPSWRDILVVVCE